MPYQYLNNQGLWGDTAEGMGNAFNNTVVGLTRLRMQQSQQDRQAQMDRAYLDLAVRQLGQQKELKGQELAAEAPVNQARVGLMQAQTKGAGVDSEAQQRAMEVQKRNQGLGDVAGNAQRVLQAIMNPVSDKMPFQGVPYRMETNPAATQQVPISPELRQQLGPQTQFSQPAMQNALEGIIKQAAMQALFSGQQGATAIPQGVAMTQAGAPAMMPTLPRQQDPTLNVLQRLAPLARGDQFGRANPMNEMARNTIMQLLGGMNPQQGQGEAEQGGTTTEEMAEPLPDSQEKLIAGKKYKTARGVATWDGQQFIQ